MPKADWQLWEGKVAGDLGGKITPGSGNKWFSQGDVRRQDLIVSCKSTSNNSFSITRADINEIEKIAFKSRTSWAIAIDLSGRKVMVVDYEEYVLEHQNVDE